MPEVALSTVRLPAAEQIAYWPRAVACLAVVAHFCIADVIGVNSVPKSELAIVRDGAILLAQADLLLIWLVLGGTRWIRRLPWSLCGLSAVGLVLYMHNFNEVFGELLAAYLAHLVTTAAVIGFLRFRDLRIENVASEKSPEEIARSRRQFTILDLLGASLAVAIAVAWVLRMEPPTPKGGDAGLFVMLTFMAAPLTAITLMAALGMRHQRGLVMQILLAAFIAIFLPNALADEVGRQYWPLYSAHWFLVAATLWIFQMCGCRLVRTSTM